MTLLRVPLATYRIQFNAQFTFADARAIVPYLHDLGITEIYSSPILRARKGSMHGYDIVDPTALNPELGTDDDFTELSGALDAHGMGFVLDIVPNHMAASHENPWWMGLLEHGLESRYRYYFDVDWQNEKIVLPILGRPYGEALEAHEITLDFDADGLFFLYYDKRLPVAPRSYGVVLRECLASLPKEGVGSEIHQLVQKEVVITNSLFIKETLWRVHNDSPEFREVWARTLEHFNKDVNALDRLLDAQWYRLAYWRIASETINYRRFFDVTDLVGLCIENPEVFEQRNKRIVDWIVERRVTGLRIDHIDGLREPVDYLTRLQLRLGDASTQEREQFYVVVEKILAHHEELPRSFACAGTTGYDFMDTANAVFVDPKGLAQIEAPFVFEDLVYERKKQVIRELFSGEMRSLGMHLGRLAEVDRNARDFAPSELMLALEEITACMPVYRTYIDETVSEEDREVILRASAEARRRAKGVDERLFRFVELVLLLEPPDYIVEQRQRWTKFVMRWQQFTPRVMAKGVEDTAFYNYHRLISLNEVGGEPGRGEFEPVAELHERNAAIARDWPHTMNATSTHDTKRSEDVRARISVLSEMPDWWGKQVKRWSKMNASRRVNGIPDANTEQFVYQTLLGMWPLEESEEASVPDRLRAYFEKASREAKTHTSWLTPNAEYEKALQDFATGILEGEEFRNSFRRFQRLIAYHGFLNALSQVVLKATSPGVPDFYQGTELWDFSLVDPDNRRPVDYAKRREVLASLKNASPFTLLRNWRDGQIKMYVTSRCLATRAKHADVFLNGAYGPLEASEHVVAYTRGDSILVAVPRLTTRLGKEFPFEDSAWGDASLAVSGAWRNVFTGEVLEGETLAVKDVFASFPVAVFEKV
jgi:(1->4)-alpha-D-glucan 1-alpha-D-glucosylmutase